VVVDGALQMGRLIDDLLSLSRIGRKELTVTALDLKEMVEGIILEVEREEGERAIEWEVGELPVVQADPALLRVALVNLLANAVKYTRGRPVARIAIVALPPTDGRAVVRITDNGAGFDMTYAHKLFGVFQRLHRSEEFEWTGIGLATVKRILHRHGGEIEAEGRPGEGASFTFSLPKE
jgi:two-component system, chemotaxis family, sensor kinase Cph1